MLLEGNSCSPGPGPEHPRPRRGLPVGVVEGRLASQIMKLMNREKRRLAVWKTSRLPGSGPGNQFKVLGGGDREEQGGLLLVSPQLQAGWLMSCASRMHPGKGTQTCRPSGACSGGTWKPRPAGGSQPSLRQGHSEGKGLGLGAGTPYPEEDRRGSWKEGGGRREAVRFVFSSP